MQTETQNPTSVGCAQSAAAKYLTFALGKESYAIPVLKVREIIKLVPATAVPQLPEYFKGVINLRGKIIPVIDMRLKFALAVAENTSQTCIIVVQINKTNGAPMHMGLIVDAVEEVAYLNAVDIEQTPDFGTQVDTSYILGMAKIKGNVKALLDIDRVLGIQDMSVLESKL